MPHATLIARWLSAGDAVDKTADPCKCVNAACHPPNHPTVAGRPINQPRRIQIGAKAVYIEDLRDDFLKNYILPSIQANGIYEKL